MQFLIPTILLFTALGSKFEESVENETPAKQHSKKEVVTPKQTIADKKASFTKGENELDKEMHQHLLSVNLALAEERSWLKELYARAQELYLTSADEHAYLEVLADIKACKERIENIHHLWRKEVGTLQPSESYALIHEPETQLFQLIMDYGASDHIYIIPQDIGAIRLNINSNLPIPRESWEECLEMILAQYGIGIRQLNSYLRELYMMDQHLTGLKAITDSVTELASYPAKSAICFIMSGEEDPRRALNFFKKFTDQTTTKIEIFGGKLFIIATVDTITELFKLYDFVKEKTAASQIEIVTLNKIDPKEIQSILELAFPEDSMMSANEGLRVIPLSALSHSIVLAGTRDEVKRAVKLIEDLESKIENPQEKTLFWYTAKHSNAEELAATLAKVYDLIATTGSPMQGSKIDAQIARVKEENKSTQIVAPEKVQPGAPSKPHKTADGKNNFIVDYKTSSIMMVVEQDALPKIKQLLKKLDCPKKMVQIEVLLFEKKMENHSKCGLNLLRLGTSALNTAKGFGLNWNGKGILEFLFSKPKSNNGIPAYDLAYNFLLGQDDVQINACPSITTMNQTPAKIAIVEEISIDAGADEKKNTLYKRAEYGIIMQITPTINFEDDPESDFHGETFITLDTDITFDSTKKNSSDRPEVTRRHIKNYVRIGDGQTVIIGGLRRKNQEDKKDSIPFLGEIPGIGKLFSSTEISDSSTEMFIFITPKVISDPIEDAEKLKLEALSKRAGDVPEFLQELQIAKDREKRKLFANSMQALFGRDETCSSPLAESREEYNGR